MGTLTVKENLYFSANLRMSKRVSQEEKDALIMDTLSELGLTHCANTKVLALSIALMHNALHV